ncbi:SMI1/KNR4 family protein [Catellatospora coxensis]|uniref:SUKH superfamily protein n=1 Tax=Catellatospora coxensis TaxID=310354 RepID=A0A8J3P6W8_9ACTN|nr:SMI1/KNR4 family protein [Catellatospora coxensis]GIG05944.1 hypothetical protein Cco03nite_26440 [Catellatospora coxensis]
MEPLNEITHGSGRSPDAAGDDHAAKADRLQPVIERFAQLVDPPAETVIAQILTDAGWSPRDPSGRGFASGDMTAAVRSVSGGARVSFELAGFGCSDDLDYDDFEDDDAYSAAVDQQYLDAEAGVATVAARLGLPAADDLAVDPLIYHGSRVRLRAGHWAVTVAAAQEDTDLPILLEVDVTYGADLPGRLAQLAPPPSAGTPVDWDAVSSRLGVALPADYRWLAERYGGGMVGGRISVLPPDELSPPLLGPLKGPLRYMTARTLPIATTADGALVSWVLDPEDQPGQWGLRSCATGHPDEELEIGLLHYLVVTLSGAYRAWGRRQHPAD